MKQMNRKMLGSRLSLLFFTSLMLLMTGCGQKGDLFLPVDEDDISNKVTPDNSTSATTEPAVPSPTPNSEASLNDETEASQ